MIDHPVMYSRPAEFLIVLNPPEGSPVENMELPNGFLVVKDLDAIIQARPEHGLLMNGPSVFAQNPFSAGPPLSVIRGSRRHVFQVMRLARADNITRGKDVEFADARDAAVAVDALVQALQGHEPVMVGGYRLVSASYNLLVQPSWCGGGPCPGFEPLESGRGGNWNQEQLKDLVVEVASRVTEDSKSGDSLGSGVRVAILDSWPLEALKPANFASRPFAPHAGFQEVMLSGAKAGAVGVLSVARSMMVPNAGASWEVFDCVPRDGELGSPLHEATSLPYVPGEEDLNPLEPPQEGRGGGSIASHGLFVADILSRLAPHAKFSVYRVIGDTDVGDLTCVARAVEHAIAHSKAQGEKLVMNMSFAFGPWLAELEKGLNRYLSETDWVDPATSIREWLEELKLLDEDECLAKELEAEGHVLMYALKHLFDAGELAGDDIFVVAAAGNDSFVPDYNTRKSSQRAGPRFPAVIEGVLGVSGVKKNGRDSHFSNRNDLRGTLLDGVGAFGEYIRGLYVQEQVLTTHNDGTNHLETNQTGWARWSGTSFAAPVASALAACLMSEGVQTNELMNAIVLDEDRLERDYLPVFQN